jgi:PAS domain S-box-containing protein
MTKLLRILHLEDSPADAELVEHVLRKAGFDVTLLRVESHTDFIAGLESLQPDIILADYRLPIFDGMQALAIAREKYSLTPFIFVTGMMGEEASIQMLKNGASDYIIKDRLTRLPNAIRQALEKQKEIARRIQSEQDLLASETKFRTIFESSADAILLQDDHGFIDCNPAALKLFGCASRNDLIGQHPARISARTQAGGEGFLSLADQIIAKALKNGIQRFEWTCRRLDGVEFLAEILVVAIEIDSRKILHVTARDITEHKIRQTKVQRLTNFFAALSQINQTILRCSSEAELFPKICRYLVQYGGMKMAWVGMVDEVTRQLNPVASYGEGEGILQGIQISVVADDSGSHEPIGVSFRKDQMVLCQDCQHDTAAEVWQKYAAQYGWGSSASLPLHRKGLPVGVLSLYTDTVNAFDEEACKLLDEMAIDVSFALDIFIREAERILNVAILKDSEQRFRTLIEQSIAGVYIIQGGKFTYVNPRFVEILGYSATDELLDRDPLKIIASKDCNRVEKQLNKLIKKEVLSDSYVCSMLHKDGKLVDV